VKLFDEVCPVMWKGQKGFAKVEKQRHRTPWMKIANDNIAKA